MSIEISKKLWELSLATKTDQLDQKHKSIIQESKKSTFRRMQKGSGWAGWGCPGSIQNPNYSRAHVIPLISEMGDYNPYT